MPLFTEHGNTIEPSSTATLTERGQSLTLIPAAGGGAGARPTLNTATLHFVTADCPLAQGVSAPVKVGLSSSGMLVINVSPQVESRLNTKDVTLLGLTIARARLKVDPVQLKGVVVSTQ